MTPRLTVNAGARFEREFMPPYQRVVNGREVANPIDFGWGDKIAPRIGAAWDITGSGHWKLSGSFGIFYDVMKYALARTAFGGETWMSYVYRLDSTNLSALSLSTPGALGAPITTINNRSVPVNDKGEWEGVDPSIKPYASREMTLSLERRFRSRFVLARVTRAKICCGQSRISVSWTRMIMRSTLLVIRDSASPVILRQSTEATPEWPGLARAARETTIRCV